MSDLQDDADNFLLSQLSIPCTYEVNNFFDLMPINQSDVQKVNVFDDNLDLILSQVADEMESEYQCEESLKNMTISQCVAEYLEDDLPDFLLDFDMETNESDNSVDVKEEPHNKDIQSRFGQAVSKTEIDQLINSQKNPNTEKNTRWAVDAFAKWREARNRSTGENIPLITEMHAETMNDCLQRFCLEVRKQDGSEYPPKSLYYIMGALLRHLKNENIYDKNFLDDSDPRFAVFRKVLDAKMKELASRGLGSKVKQADPIYPEDEQKIWDSHVFGMDSSQTLQYTMFFYNCKMFGMRGYDEHRNLECEQFVIGVDERRGKFVHFIGRSNKTYKGGIKQMQLSNKDIKHFCTTFDDGRCIADYYEKYIAALGNRGFFYRRPLAGPTIRYSEQVLGVNKIKGLMKEIATKAGLEGNFSNHSGKRTCATQLYDAGIPEQEIMSRTGHRSETAVRKYKRSSEDMLAKVSTVLNPPMKKEKNCEELESVNDSEEKKMEISPFRDITNLPENAVFNHCTFNFGN